MKKLTFNPYPESSLVTLISGTTTATGVGKQSIIVEDGDAVTWSVSAEQCATQQGVETSTETKNVDIVLKYVGSVINDTLIPSTGKDKFPTHVSNLGKGGWHQVQTLEARDLIPQRRRSAGMGVYVTDEKKLYTLKEDLITWEEFETGKIDSISLNDVPLTPDVNKNVNIDLSYLQDQIDKLKAIGRFLSLWNAKTGLPTSNPLGDEYPYQTGDYYVVGFIDSDSQYEVYDPTKVYFIGDKVTHEGLYYICNTDETTGEWDSTKWDSHIITNYKPDGTIYHKDVPSTVIESESVNVNDMYMFDGSVWNLLKNSQKAVTFASIIGLPEENVALKNSLDKKQDVLTEGYGISIAKEDDDTVISCTIDTADEIKYTTTTTTEITNVKEALDTLLDQMYYTKPSVVSLVTNMGGSDVFELGDSRTITSITFKLNKQFSNFISIKLNNVEIPGWKLDPSLTTFTYTFPTPETISSLKEYKITVTDDHINSASATVSYNFVKYKYYGISTEETLTNDQIKSLHPLKNENIGFSESEFNFGTTGAYFYYALPTSIINAAGRDPYFKAGPTGGLNPQQGNYFVIHKPDFINGKGMTVPLTIYKFMKRASGTSELIFNKLCFKAE